MPRLLRDIIISSLSPHADLEVTEVELSSPGPGRRFAAEEVDVLVLGADGAELGGDHEQLLWSHPRLRILAIDGGGRQAALYRLEAHRHALDELSTEGLADAIRSAWRPGRAGELLETGPPR